MGFILVIMSHLYKKSISRKCKWFLKRKSNLLPDAFEKLTNSNLFILKKNQVIVIYSNWKFNSILILFILKLLSFIYWNWNWKWNSILINYNKWLPVFLWIWHSLGFISEIVNGKVHALNLYCERRWQDFPFSLPPLPKVIFVVPVFIFLALYSTVIKWCISHCLWSWLYLLFTGFCHGW